MTKNFKALAAAVLIFALGAGTGVASNAAGTDPGTQSDPLVSKSYVDQRIAELANSINAANSGNAAAAPDSEVLMAQVEYLVKDYLSKNSGTLSGTAAAGSAASFAPVSVSAGKTIYGGEGAEFILRSGAGTVVTTTESIINVTTGRNLATGATVPAGNLLVIPRNDGRGIKVTQNAWIMVKGSYTVQ